MMPMKDFDWVQRDLTERFEQGMLRKPVSLVAIIFSRPDCALAKGEILPAIDYFNERGNNTVFYFAGYDPETVKAAQASVQGREMSVGTSRPRLSTGSVRTWNPARPGSIPVVLT